MSADEIEVIGSAVEVAPPPPAEGVMIFRKAVAMLDDQRKAMVEAHDTVGLSWGSAQLGLIAGDMADLIRSCRSDLAVLVTDDYGEAKGKPKLDIEGLGRVEVESGWERKNWESPKLLRRLMMLAITDRETGELMDGSPLDALEAIFTVLSDCLPLTGSLQWKVGQLDRATDEWTGLRKYGISDEDYCERVDKPVLAKVPKISRTA